MEIEVYPLEEELVMLEADQVRLRRNAFQEIVLERDGHAAQSVHIVRGFPHSARGRMISLRDTDGQEIGLVKDIQELDAESRKLLEDELERLYFVPRITRVDEIIERFHIPQWTVMTDRGPRQFEIRSGRSDVHVHAGGRILIRDADGNHFEIPDYRRLDAASRARIESQV